MGHVASMVQHNVVGGNNEVHHIVVGPVLRGFSDDTESLGLLTTVNLMVSFVIAFCKCCVEVMERTTSHCLKLPNVPCSKIHHITVAYRGGGVQTPPKFRRYQSPRSHEQEDPESRFPFVVHCVLIWL